MAFIGVYVMISGKEKENKTQHLPGDLENDT